MSWYKRDAATAGPEASGKTLKAVLIVLICAVLLQIGFLGFLWARATLASQSSQGTLATLAWLSSPPSLASFDPETSLTMFVVWSQDQLEDTQFQGALPIFTARVEAELERYAAETGVTIIREGAVLAGARVPDVTTAIMERVLADAAF